MAESEINKPLFTAALNGTSLPSKEIRIEQSTYGQADVIYSTIVCSKATEDYGAVSQSGKYLPLTIQAGMVGGSVEQVQYAYLDEINTDYALDEIEFSARGLLSVLLDTKISLKASLNVDVTTAISNVITNLGMQANVNNGQPSGIDAGNLLVNDFSTMTKNIKAMDYINLLAFGVGWRPRVQGNVIIVGPPPYSAPVLSKSVAKGGLIKCNVKHSALHAHDISVRVVSYVPNHKTRVVATAGTTGQGGDTTDEQYVFSIPGLDQNSANYRATQIQAELSRHEFILEMEFALDSYTLPFLVKNSPEFQIQLEDASQESHNQLYTPRRVNWYWDQDKGGYINIVAVNHAEPQG